MFREFPCGCLVSELQGRVRICGTHALSHESRDGYGGLAASTLKGRTKFYPANGETVPGWAGR